jgi:hypothetical protein
MFAARMYLDFDGVVHAKNPHHYNDARTFTIAIEGSRYLSPISTVTFSPTLVQQLDRLLHEYNVELVWATTWNDRNDVLRLSEFLGGLHNGRVLTANLNTEATNKGEWTQWKADAILEDQKMDSKPFVWLDDSAHSWHSETVLAATSETPSLILTPVSEFGISILDLEAIEEFLQEITTKAEEKVSA